MKQIIYSTGVFETELTITPPAEDPSYNAPYRAIIRQPQYELRKTSQCLTKFIIERDDRLVLQDLSNKSNKALKDLRDGVILLNECHKICEKEERFRKMFQKALNNQSGVCENIQYIEIADETSQGCHAIYRFTDGMVNSEIPCKIGEALEQKYDPEYCQFSPIKIVANNG